VHTVVVGRDAAMIKTARSHPFFRDRSHYHY
jgi:hypothetical protein